jgi:thymidine phosphorylase
VSADTLRLRRLGIDTYTDPVVFMRRDCHVCRSEGFEARARVKVSLDARSIVATLNVVSDALLAHDEAGLSEHAWRVLEAHEGAQAAFSHPEPAASESRLRAKVYGARLDAADMEAIVGDVASGNYSDLHLAAFVTAGAGDRLDEAETIALTRAMAGVGEHMRWSFPLVADKHCVGGLPGNRTTPLVVAIVAACGVPIPKTSSRAITSPAGTADTMEVLAPVDLDVPAMRRVVEREGGCIVWGGAVRLSPADDILIRVERPLDFDSEGQLVASVLDDIISSARTMALAARRIREAGLAAPVCVGVHGIFSPDALDALRAEGVTRIVTTNTIAHETNAIDVSGLIARNMEDSVHEPKTR